MRFCFYGSGIYDALIGNPAGGAELQIALLAKALSLKKHQVTVIDNKGNGKNIKVGNITVLFTAKSKVKGLRFIFEKIPNSFRYLLMMKSDIYYVRGFSYMYLIVVIVTWHLKSKFILSIASDIDVLKFNKRFRYVFQTKTSIVNWLKNDLLSVLVGEILLRNAALRLVQHSHQKKELLKRNLSSVIFPNIILPTSYVEDQSLPECFVYVGSLNERKGISELLSVIEKCNTIKFKIIGRPQGNFAKKKAKIIKSYPHVQFLGQLSRDSVIREIANSKGLINFSKMEGFPNTFIEAWLCGKPTLSLWVDPGGVIEKFQLGKCFAGDLDSMTDFITENTILKPSMHYKEYVYQNHSFENAASKLLMLL